MKSLLLFTTLALSLSISLHADDSTISSTENYAYSANAGWINCRPSTTDGLVVNERYLAQYAYSANFGWIHFGDGSPDNGHTYQNNSSTDYGVNHDGAGALSGYAYAANIGWIYFGDGTEEGTATIDLSTGELDGYAYSGNVGWINMGAGYLTVSSISRTDSDADNIADDWEWNRFGALSTATENSDTDGDGISDYEEYLANTDPNEADDFLKILSVTYDSTYTSADVEFTSKQGRLYALESDDDLTAPWTDSGLGSFLPDSGGSTTETISWSSSDKQFIRVSAELPLTP